MSSLSFVIGSSRGLAAYLSAKRALGAVSEPGVAVCGDID